jgi:hypothetical protein
MKHVIFFLSLMIFSCGNNNENQQKFTSDWEMDEVFYDQTSELMEDGGFCPYYYREDSKLTDSLEIENDNSIVAIIVQPTIKVNQTKANIWIQDQKIDLLLVKDETKGTQKYTRTFDSPSFEVEVTMKLVEVIDGMGEGDMFRYSGTMNVVNKETKKTKSFKIQGGC